MKPHELKVMQDFYEVKLHLTRRIERFPRHLRYTLGADTERRLKQIWPCS